MKIILFGGAEIGKQVGIQFKQIEKVIKGLEPKQILHVPFARSKSTEMELGGKDWFKKQIIIKNSEYLNAANKIDVKKAKTPLIFISGGGRNVHLLKKIKSDPKLHKLIINSKCIIGESAGAKILAEYFRTIGSDDESKIMKGLNLITDTVIEPHYTQRKRQKLLIKDIEDTGVRYGIGIDTCTAMEFESDKFPGKYKKIGNGLVEIKELIVA